MDNEVKIRNFSKTKKEYYIIKMSKIMNQKNSLSWRTVKLSDAVRIIGGGTPKTSVPEYWNGSIPWLSPPDFNDQNRYVEKTKKRITELGLNNSATTLLKAGDLILSARGTVGALAQLKKPMAFSQTSYGLKRKLKSVSNNFLFYIIKYNIKKFKQLSYGAVFDTITTRNFDEVQISLPPLEEQKRIVEVLSTWDEAIEKMDQLISAKQKQFKWLSNKLLSQKGWPKVKLGDVCILEYGTPLREKDRKTGGYPVFGSNGIVGYHNTYLVKGPFIIVGRKGTAGSITYSEKNGYPIDTTFYIKFRNKNEISIKFFFYILQTLGLKNMNKQTGVPGLNRNDAYKVNFPLPLLHIQKGIAVQLNLFEDSMQLLKIVKQKYEKQKKGLMQKLLTGKWRMKI